MRQPLLASLACCVLLGAAPALAAPSAGDVKKALKSGDADQAREVLEQLAGQLDKATIKAVLDTAPKAKALGIYPALRDCLRSASGEAAAELVKAYKKAKKPGPRFLVVDALGGVEAEGVVETLARAVEKDKDESIRVQAARMLGQRKSAAAVSALIPLLVELEADGKEERLVREINGALTQLTGEPISVAEDWTNYWATHEDGYTPPVEEEPADDKGRKGRKGDGETRTAMDRMKEQRPAEMKTITRMQKGGIVVIEGRSDRVEQVLRTMGLEHEVHKREDFDGLKLDPESQILILNCPGRDEFSDDGVRKVAEFVAKGGYLFCSDWELKKTLCKAFPKAVQFHGETERGDNQTVRIYPAKGAENHPLMRDVFPLNAWERERGFAWVLEQRSHLAKPNGTLTPLVDCPELKQYGVTTVAFCFRYGRKGARPVTGGKRQDRRDGLVLFVSSHFKLQKDESGDGFALQQLLLNFILEKQEQRKALRLGK